MRMGKLLGGVVLAVGLFLPAAAAADQARDWLFSEQRPEGASAILDVVAGGVQGAAEYRKDVYGAANQLTVRGSSLVALPFASAQADLELRILNIIVGASIGGIDSWREMIFDDGALLHRKERRFREASAEFIRKQRLFYEGRALMALPFNEYVFGVSSIRYRIDGYSDRTYDLLGGSINVRDDGMFEWNSMLFFKHKHFGAIAPTFTHQRFERGGRDVEQNLFGLLFLSRASLVRRNDMIVFALQFHNSDWTGGTDEGDNFGMHMLRGPVSFLLAYRAVIDFYNADTDDDEPAPSAGPQADPVADDDEDLE